MWETIEVAWYGGQRKVLEMASATAIWYHAGRPPVAIRWVLIRDPDGRLEPQALLSTDLLATPTQIVEWFVLRWQLEVTFAEARRHLGVETQRQWSDLAILRTTPALLGLFALITLLTDRLQAEHRLPARAAAWYPKPQPTFADALALVRRTLWNGSIFSISPDEGESIKIRRELFDHLTTTLAYAA